MLAVAGGIRGLLEWRFRPIDLNAEVTIPALFSGGLLAFAVVTGVFVWRFEQQRGGGRAWPLLGVAILFAFMAVDEVASVHENVDDAVGHWQLFYMPVLLAGAVCWLGSLRHIHPRDPARRLFVLGAGAWILSQVVDVIQYRGFGEQLAYPVLIVPEEALEMAGSALFGLALLITLQWMRRSGPASASPSP